MSSCLCTFQRTHILQISSPIPMSGFVKRQAKQTQINIVSKIWKMGNEGKKAETTALT